MPLLPFIVFGAAVIAWFLRIGMLIHGASFDRLSNGLDTRADALLIGCSLGLAVSLTNLAKPADTTRRLLEILSPLSCVALLYIAIFSEWHYSETYLWKFFAVALLTGIIILDILVRPRSLLKKILSVPALVWTGRISYGLFLWHCPIYSTLTALHLNGRWFILLGTGLTFLIAAISYYYLESYFLKNRAAQKITVALPK